MYAHTSYLFHEFIFGTVAANLIIVLTLLRYLHKTWRKYHDVIVERLEEHRTLWEEHEADIKSGKRKDRRPIRFKRHEEETE